MSIVIKNKLGEGVQGKVFNILFNGKPAIYKIEKIPQYIVENQEIMTYKCNYYNQVMFHDNVAKKHPQLFMQLVSHGILNDCNALHITKNPLYKDKKLTAYIKKQIQKSNTCYFLIYTPIYKKCLCTSYNKVYSDSKMFLKMVSQISLMLNIMHIDSYAHRDIHTENIMIDDKNNFYLIDYGYAIYSKDENGIADDITYRLMFNDFYMFIINCCVYNPIGSLFKKNTKKSIPLAAFNKNLYKIADAKLLAEIDKYIPNKLTGDESLAYARLIIVLLLNYGVFLDCYGFDHTKYTYSIGDNDKYKYLFLDIIKNSTGDVKKCITPEKLKKYY